MSTLPWKALTSFRSLNVFNPWAESDPLDRKPGSALLVDATAAVGPAGRKARLAAHFWSDAKLVFVGEAPGYQGCHFSGLPFTSERLLCEGRVPRIAACDRLTSRQRPWSEPSATIVWDALHDYGLAEGTVLWNAFAWHPFEPGNRYSNRTPTDAERAAGRDVLDAMLDAVPKARIVAVGRVAGRLLQTLGRTPYAEIRHPANGGATEFRHGVATLARRI